jgi:hypothetical protein
MAFNENKKNKKERIKQTKPVCIQILQNAHPSLPFLS